MTPINLRYLAKKPIESYWNSLEETGSNFKPEILDMIGEYVSKKNLYLTYQKAFKETNTSFSEENERLKEMYEIKERLLEIESTFYANINRT